MVSVQTAHPQPRRRPSWGGERPGPAPHLPALQHHVRRLEGEGEAAVGLDVPGEGPGVVVEDVLLYGGVDAGAEVPIESAVDTAGP